MTQELFFAMAFCLVSPVALPHFIEMEQDLRQHETGWDGHNGVIYTITP